MSPAPTGPVDLEEMTVKEEVEAFVRWGRFNEDFFNRLKTNEGHDAVLETGAIEPLLALIRDGTQLVEEGAASVILSMSTTVDGCTAIVESGGVDTLVVLLGKVGASMKSKESAACALSWIAKYDIGRAAIMQSGAAQPLVALLRDGTQLVEEGAASVFFSLSKTVDGCAAIVESGGVDALVVLLGKVGASMSSKESAACALSWIALSDIGRAALLQAGSAQPLVAVLLTGTPLIEEGAAAALTALSSTVDGRAAIMEAGGVNAIMTLQQNGTQKAKDFAIVIHRRIHDGILA